MEDLKRLTINLATAPFSYSVQKSSRSFDTGDELVGLGIVAAMSTTTTDRETRTSSSKINHRVRGDKILSAVMTKKPMIGVGGSSKSIPIRSSSGSATALGFQFGGERAVTGGGFEDEVLMEMEMEMEMSESYTCVVSLIGNDKVRKREYFDDRLLSGDSKSTAVVTRGVFSRSLAEVVEYEEKPVWEGVDFLSSCFLCGKGLRGIDIFMYRGEKAFCSVECRDMHIATDKHKEKRGRVRMRSVEHSESPCCSPMLSYTGVVAA